MLLDFSNLDLQKLGLGRELMLGGCALSTFPTKTRTGAIFSNPKFFLSKELSCLRHVVA